MRHTCLLGCRGQSIEATLWRELADRYFDVLEEGKARPAHCYDVPRQMLWLACTVYIWIMSTFEDARARPGPCLIRHTQKWLLCAPM